MLFLIWGLLLSAGASNAVLSQKLACAYSEVQQKNLPKVWCKQNSSDCCTGVILNDSAQLLDGGKLSVIHNKDSFTVTPLKLSHGGGIYWCGVLSKNDEFIKLAEGYFYSSSGAYIWSYVRWMLLPLLLMGSIFASVYSRSKSHQQLTHE